MDYDTLQLYLSTNPLDVPASAILQQPPSTSITTLLEERPSAVSAALNAAAHAQFTNQSSPSRPPHPSEHVPATRPAASGSCGSAGSSACSTAAQNCLEHSSTLRDGSACTGTGALNTGTATSNATSTTHLHHHPPLPNTDWNNNANTNGTGPAMPYFGLDTYPNQIDQLVMMDTPLLNTNTATTAHHTTHPAHSGHPTVGGKSQANVHAGGGGGGGATDNWAIPSGLDSSVNYDFLLPFTTLPPQASAPKTVSASSTSDLDTTNLDITELFTTVPVPPQAPIDTIRPAALKVPSSRKRVGKFSGMDASGAAGAPMKLDLDLDLKRFESAARTVTGDEELQELNAQVALSAQAEALNLNTPSLSSFERKGSLTSAEVSTASAGSRSTSSTSSPAQTNASTSQSNPTPTSISTSTSSTSLRGKRKRSDLEAELNDIITAAYGDSAITRPYRKKGTSPTGLMSPTPHPGANHGDVSDDDIPLSPSTSAAMGSMEPTTAAAERRRRNTQASQRFRLRKKQKERAMETLLSTLKKQVLTLEGVIHEIRGDLAKARAENDGLKEVGRRIVEAVEDGRRSDDVRRMGELMALGVSGEVRDWRMWGREEEEE